MILRKKIRQIILIYLQISKKSYNFAPRNVFAVFYLLYTRVIMNKKFTYKTPETAFISMRLHSQILGGSQSWQSNVPVNAERKGYGEGVDVTVNW